MSPLIKYNSEEAAEFHFSLILKKWFLIQMSLHIYIRIKRQKVITSKCDLRG